jgi:DNA-binding PadR family transcriptional regulator
MENIVALKKHWYHILLALAEGPAHGAEIRRRVGKHTRGSLELYPAMLYGSVEDLLERGWVREVDEKSGRPAGESDRYRYLDLTAAGRETLAAETEEYQEVVRIARDLLTKEVSP